MTDVRLDKPRAKWLLAIAAISTLLLVILLALGVLGGDKKIQPGNRLATGQTLPNTAKTLTLSTKSAANTLAWQGTVRSRSLVKITPKLTARILEIPVHAGDHLKPGQVIARLDQRDLQAAYNAANSAYLAAQAQAAQAKSEEVRITALYNQQAATRQNYEAVLSQAKSAQAIANQAASAAQQTQVMLGENSLYAPFDGVVAERFQEPGDMASPNQAVVSFLKPDDLRLELAVADNCTAALKLGLSVTVRVDGLAHRLIGKVDEISPEIDAQTRSQPLKIS